MSFNPLNFIITRSSNGQLPTIFSPAIHMYGTTVDNLAACSAPGYFNLLIPPKVTFNFSGGINDNFVLVGDIITVHATDGTVLLVISSITSTTITTSRLIPTISGTFTSNYAGPWTVQPSVTASYVLNNDMVMIHFPLLSHAADGVSSTIISISALPTSIRPTNTGTRQVIRVLNNAAGAAGIVEVNPAGIMVFYSDMALSNFTGPAGNAGFDIFTLSYKLS